MKLLFFPFSPHLENESLQRVTVSAFNYALHYSVSVEGEERSRGSGGCRATRSGGTGVILSFILLRRRPHLKWKAPSRQKLFSLLH